MNLADRAYLHLRASILQNYQLEAEGRGEVFHVADNFAQLSDGKTLAQAQWQHENATRRLVLRLRQPLETFNEKQVDAYASFFYDNTPFTAYPSVTVTNKGLIERAFVCDAVKQS